MCVYIFLGREKEGERETELLSSSKNIEERKTQADQKEAETADWELKETDEESLSSSLSLSMSVPWFGRKIFGDGGRDDGRK